MSKTKFIDFKVVKAALTMEGVLEHYGLLDKFKRSGDSLSGPCPIHKGTNPTQFRVSISKNIWNCFSECKHGGNALDFIVRMENVSILEAAIKAVDWFQIDDTAMADGFDASAEKSETKETPAKVRPTAKQAANTAVEVAVNTPLKFRLDKLDVNHPYLLERGLTPETIACFGIGFCSKGMMADRIAIPIQNAAGEVVAYAGRFAGEPTGDVPKYKLPQGFRKSLELFNIHRAILEPRELPLVIVEGFFDCIMLYQNGYKKVVALMGSSMSVAQEKLIQANSNPRSLIVVMLDEDEAGRTGREDIANRLAQFAFVKIHAFPEEGQQPEHLNAEDIKTLLN